MSDIPMYKPIIAFVDECCVVEQGIHLDDRTERIKNK